MEGERKNEESESEKIKQTFKRKDEVSKENAEELETVSEAESISSCVARRVMLEALNRGLEASLDRWPGDMLKAAIERFGRMPRGGWQQCHSHFCAKFNINISLEEFKSRANRSSLLPPKWTEMLKEKNY